MALTTAEYEARRRRLEADAEDARKALAAARSRYDAICGELVALRRAQNQAGS
ncbi:hypothetical protein ACIBEA_30025 [Streptomyces sp. NPDC051555]|uniref:hypothetical protein n=1 Tax=Streptomyces sp. NPDC051555 TaxID=3365657 RepID=UPI0037BBAA5F